MATLTKHDTQANRTVVLDFNGGLQVYRNHELGLNIPAQLEPGDFSAARRAGLVSTMNREYASHGVRFTTDATPGASAVHIGRTDAFDRYGRFLGLAEGIGSGDAFVLLDASSNDTELTDVIRHEAGHILGTLDHGGAGLARYGWEGEIYDYFGASRGHEDPEYKVYLRRVTTTTYIYQYVAAPAEAENIYLRHQENGKTVKYWYSSQYRQYETSTEHVNETRTEECCNKASGSRAKAIYIRGKRNQLHSGIYGCYRLLR